VPVGINIVSISAVMLNLKDEEYGKNVSSQTSGFPPKTCGNDNNLDTR